MGVGRRRRVLHGVDLRPHPLGRHARRPLARRRARPRRRGRRSPIAIRLGTLVATPNFRHPVTLARDALALDDLSERPARPRPRAGQRGLRRLGARARSRGRRRSAWPASRSSSTSSSRSSTASRRRARRCRPSTTRANEAPSTPGARAAAAPAHHRRRRPEGTAPRRDLRRQLGHHRADRGRPPHARDRARRGAHAKSSCSTRCSPPAGRDPCDPRQGAALDADRAGHRRRRTSSTSLPLRTPRSASTSSSLHHPDQTGPFGGDVKAFEEIAARYAAG